MTQVRSFNFRDDDTTSSLNAWLLGITYPGRYVGFDLEVTNNLTLRLIHTLSGIAYNDKTNTVQPKVGVLCSKTGVVIKENAPIELNVVANLSTHQRIDLVYMEHNYLDGVVGGEQAQYGYIQGDASTNPVKPNLTNEENQIVVGYIYWPATTNTINNSVRWEKAKSPLPNYNKWNNQSVEYTDYNLSVGGNNFDLLPESSTLGHNIIVGNSADNSHVYTIQRQAENDNHKQYFFNIICNTNVNTNFEIIVRTKDDTSNYTELLKFSHDDMTNGVIRAVVLNKNGEWIVRFVNFKNQHRQGVVNRFDYASVIMPETDAIVTVDQQILTNSTNKWKSYIKVDNEELIGLTQSDFSVVNPGTSIFLQANHPNGLKIRSNVSFGNSPSRNSFTFGSSDNGYFNPNESSNEIQIKKGQIVQIVLNTEGYWVVVNENFSNRVIGVERSLGVSNDILINLINNNKPIIESIESGDLLNFVGNDGTPTNREIYLPTDDITRKITITSKATWNRETNTNPEIDGSHLLFLNAQSSGLTPGTKDFSTIGASSNSDIGGTTVCVYTFTHQGNGGYFYPIFNVFGDKFNITYIKTNYIGVPA